MKWSDFILRSLLVVSFALFATTYFIEPVETRFAFPENKVWKHRQNSSDLALKSIAAGANGIEIDIMLVDGKLRVAHDEGEIPSSQSLDDFLSALALENATPSLWLDIKNIGFTNEVQIREILLDVIDRYNLHDRLLVESPKPMRMTRLCQTIIRCSIWVQNSDSVVSRTMYRMFVRGFSNIANLSAISIDYRHPETAELIVPKSFPVLLYTFPSPDDLVEFKGNSRYKILLTD
jgi:hypothetical protein